MCFQLNVWIEYDVEEELFPAAKVLSTGHQINLRQINSREANLISYVWEPHVHKSVEDRQVK